MLAVLNAAFFFSFIPSGNFLTSTAISGTMVSEITWIEVSKKAAVWRYFFFFFFFLNGDTSWSTAMIPVWQSGLCAQQSSRNSDLSEERDVCFWSHRSKAWIHSKKITVHFAHTTNSVEAERTFSNAGLFITKLRCSLNDSSVDMLCFLREYIRAPKGFVRPLIVSVFLMYSSRKIVNYPNYSNNYSNNDKNYPLFK